MQAAANFVQDHVLDPVEGIVMTAQYKPRDDGSTMQALVWHGNMDVRMEQVPVPDITQDEDVIVKITGSTICGSDLHLYHSEILGLKKGDILGHEMMGVVDRVGPKVTKLKIGDRVVSSFQIACGSCEYCKKKLSSFCDRTNDSALMQAMYGQRDAAFLGYSHFCGGLPGAQSEYVRIPFGEVNLWQIPDNMSDEQGIYLSDVLPTSYHAVVDTSVKKGDVVGVWGGGPIGACVVKWAKYKGASRVILIDRVQDRLDWNKKHSPFVECINADTEDVMKRIYELVPAGLDTAHDCTTFHEPKTLASKVQKAAMLETDVVDTPNECIKAVKKGGSVGLIAAYAAYTNGFNIGAVMEKGVRFIGNGQAPVHLYIDEIMEIIQKGEFDPTFMITHRVPLEDTAKLYGYFDRRRVKGLEKVFIQTAASAPPAKNCPTMTRVDDWVEEPLPTLLDKAASLVADTAHRVQEALSNMTHAEATS